MPTKKLKGAAIALLFLLVFPAASLAQEHIALITDLKGEVLVAKAPGGVFQRAVWGTQLFEDDHIKTSDASHALIMYSDNHVLKLGPNNSLTISASSSDRNDDSETVATIDRDLIANASDLTLHRAGRGEISALGGLRSGTSKTAIELLSPRNTKITTTTPTFTWRSETAYEYYTVNVLTNQGLVWSGETQGNRLVYPEDAPSLNPEIQYLWRVEGEEMLKSVKSDMVTFQILSQEAATKIEFDEQRIRNLFSEDSDGSSYLFVLGSLFKKEGLLESAITTFRQLAEIHPDAALPQEILGRLYSDVGLKDEAIDALQRAVDLGQKH